MPRTDSKPLTKTTLSCKVIFGSQAPKLIYTIRFSRNPEGMQQPIGEEWSVGMILTIRCPFPRIPHAVNTQTDNRELFLQRVTTISVDFLRCLVAEHQNRSQMVQEASKTSTDTTLTTMTGFQSFLNALEQNVHLAAPCSGVLVLE